jgi:hypothetical protein
MELQHTEYLCCVYVLRHQFWCFKFHGLLSPFDISECSYLPFHSQALGTNYWVVDECWTVVVVRKICSVDEVGNSACRDQLNGITKRKVTS